MRAIGLGGKGVGQLRYECRIMKMLVLCFSLLTCMQKHPDGFVCVQYTLSISTLHLLVSDGMFIYYSVIREVHDKDT
jgi:hypothetical protein